MGTLGSKKNLHKKISFLTLVMVHGFKIVILNWDTYRTVIQNCKY